MVQAIHARQTERGDYPLNDERTIRLLSEEMDRLCSDLDELRMAFDDAIERLLLARRNIRPYRGDYMKKDEQFLEGRYHG